jgi:hypothetical protein
MYEELCLTFHRVILKFVSIIMNFIEDNTDVYIG